MFLNRYIIIFFISDRGNKSKIPEHFNHTISILVENGADPNIRNHSNSDVTDLLTEFNIAELSMLVANKMHGKKFSDLPNSFDSYMIVKDKNGVKNIMNIKSKSVPSANLQKKLDRSDIVPEKVVSPKTPNKTPEIIDNTKKTYEKKPLTNLKIILHKKNIAPAVPTATNTVTKDKDDVLKKKIADSDILESTDDLRSNKCLDKMTERTVENNEIEPTDSLKTMKRKSLLIKPGPSSKKQKPVTEKSETTHVTLRSVRKAVKDHL